MAWLWSSWWSTKTQDIKEPKPEDVVGKPHTECPKETKHQMISAEVLQECRKHLRKSPPSVPDVTLRLLILRARQTLRPPHLRPMTFCPEAERENIEALLVKTKQQLRPVYLDQTNNHGTVMAMATSTSTV